VILAAFIQRDITPAESNTRLVRLGLIHSYIDHWPGYNLVQGFKRCEETDERWHTETILQIACDPLLHYCHILMNTRTRFRLYCVLGAERLQPGVIIHIMIHTVTHIRNLHHRANRLFLQLGSHS
jgi:hypothetical protein